MKKLIISLLLLVGFQVSGQILDTTDFLNTKSLNLEFGNNKFKLSLSNIIYQSKNTEDKYGTCQNSLPEIINVKDIEFYNFQPSKQKSMNSEPGSEFIDENDVETLCWFRNGNVGGKLLYGINESILQYIKNDLVEFNYDEFSDLLPTIEFIDNKFVSLKNKSGTAENFVFTINYTKSNFKNSYQILLSNQSNQNVWKVLPLNGEYYLFLTSKQLTDIIKVYLSKFPLPSNGERYSRKSFRQLNLLYLAIKKDKSMIDNKNSIMKIWETPNNGYFIDTDESTFLFKLNKIN